MVIFHTDPGVAFKILLTTLLQVESTNGLDLGLVMKSVVIVALGLA